LCARVRVNAVQRHDDVLIQGCRRHFDGRERFARMGQEQSPGQIRPGVLNA
jgi:hypothetical protein